MIRTILNPHIKQQLLELTYEELAEIGRKLGGLQPQSVKANLRNNSEKMVVPHVQIIIKEALKLDQNTEIIEIVDIP